MKHFLQEVSSAIETGIGFREVGVVRLSGEAEDFLVDLHVVKLDSRSLS